METNLIQFNIYAGLGGSFGGAQYLYTTLAENEDEAAHIAYEEACNEYESYESRVPSFQDCVETICDEEGIDYTNPDAVTDDILEAANDLYNEERESWISYYARPTSEDTISKDDLILDYVLDDTGETDGE